MGYFDRCIHIYFYYVCKPLFNKTANFDKHAAVLLAFVFAFVVVPVIIVTISLILLGLVSQVFL